MVLRVRILSLPCTLQSHDAELHKQALRLLQRRHWSCPLLCFTRERCEFKFCRDTVLSNSGRPSFASRLCDCCDAGTEFGCCQGTVICDSRGPRFAGSSSSSEHHSSSSLSSPPLCFTLEVAFCGEVTRCTPLVAWSTDDAVVRAEQLSTSGSCWLPTTAPSCHITKQALSHSLPLSLSLTLS